MKTLIDDVATAVVVLVYGFAAVSAIFAAVTGQI